MGGKYIGITLGPIDETLSLSSSPAALWAGSYIFSWLSRQLCKKISKKTGHEAIVSPYFDPNNDTLHCRDGVGRFHDRIIVKKTEKIDINDIATIIDEVKNELAGELHALAEELYNEELHKPVKEPHKQIPPKPNEKDLRDWLTAFLRIRAVLYEVRENIIKDGAGYLDAIECESLFSPEERRNFLLDLFDHSKDDEDHANRNKAVKEFAVKALKIEPEQWQLLERGADDKPRQSLALKDLLSIAGGRVRKEKKKFFYYAVIQSDGDGMSGVFQECGADPDKLRTYSNRLLGFASAAAEEVRRYGGVTIYAGGDDLLCLAPVDNGEGKTVLELLENIRDIFARDDFFGQRENPPTLSFGIAIRYHKHPLYEAFADAGRLLFAGAKKKGGKNAAAISLKKHSGHSAEFVLKRFSANACLPCITNLLKMGATSAYLNSVSYHIHTFHALFHQALQEAHEPARKSADAPMLTKVFANVFDHDAHREGGAPGQLNEIRQLFFQARDAVLPLPEKEAKKTGKSEETTALDAILRFVQFFDEEAGDEA